MGAVKLALFGAAVVGVAIVAIKTPTESGPSDPPSNREANMPEKQRPDTPEARKEFVNIVAKKLPKATISTEGPHNEGLVIDLKNCYETINELLSEPTFTQRLDQFQFKWVTCPSGKIKITPPWR